MLLGVFTDRAIGREPRCQCCHAFPNSSNPVPGNTFPRAYRIPESPPAQALIESLGLGCVPGGIVAMLLTVPMAHPTSGG